MQWIVCDKHKLTEEIIIYRRITNGSCREYLANAIQAIPQDSNQLVLFVKGNSSSMKEQIRDDELRANVMKKAVARWAYRTEDLCNFINEYLEMEAFRFKIHESNHMIFVPTVGLTKLIPSIFTFYRKHEDNDSQDSFSYMGFPQACAYVKTTGDKDTWVVKDDEPYSNYPLSTIDYLMDDGLYGDEQREEERRFLSSLKELGLMSNFS